MSSTLVSSAAVDGHHPVIPSSAREGGGGCDGQRCYKGKGIRKRGRRERFVTDEGGKDSRKLPSCVEEIWVAVTKAVTMAPMTVLQRFPPVFLSYPVA